MEKNWKELVELANKYKEEGDWSLANVILQLALCRKVDEGVDAPLLQFTFHLHCKEFIDSIFGNEKSEEEGTEEYKNWLKNG